MCQGLDDPRQKAEDRFNLDLPRKVGLLHRGIWDWHAIALRILKAILFPPLLLLKEYNLRPPLIKFGSLIFVIYFPVIAIVAYNNIDLTPVDEPTLSFQVSFRLFLVLFLTYSLSSACAVVIFTHEVGVSVFGLNVDFLGGWNVNATKLISWVSKA
jgi:hypothetical protein